MIPALFLKLAINPALALLPAKMNSGEAKAMMIAIALQESRLLYRKQIRGPARGFFQFEEQGGVRGVLTHAQTKPVIIGVLERLQYSPLIDTSYEAIAHNDVLAACYARLLLWTHPDKLPGPSETERAWQMYLDTWRPGKPHPGTWAAFYKEAWEELRRL